MEGSFGPWARVTQVVGFETLPMGKVFSGVPFFWTEQYDLGIAYVGHAEQWDGAETDGQLDAQARDCTITYRRRGKKLAVAVVHRDLEGLRAEVAFERAITAKDGDARLRATASEARAVID